MKPEDLKALAAELAIALNRIGAVDLSGIRANAVIESIENCLSRYIPPKCKTAECRNEARYNSGYCGVCDLIHNDGKGIRKCDIQNE